MATSDYLHLYSLYVMESGSEVGHLSLLEISQIQSLDMSTCTRHVLYCSGSSYFFSHGCKSMCLCCLPSWLNEQDPA